MIVLQPVPNHDLVEYNNSLLVKMSSSEDFWNLWIKHLLHKMSHHGQKPPNSSLSNTCDFLTLSPYDLTEFKGGFWYLVSWRLT